MQDKVWVAVVQDDDGYDIIALFAGGSRDDVVEQLANWCSREWLETDMVNDHGEPAHLPGPCNQQKVDYYFNFWDEMDYTIQQVDVQDKYSAPLIRSAQAKFAELAARKNVAPRNTCCQATPRNPLTQAEVSALQLLFRGKAREKFF